MIGAIYVYVCCATYVCKYIYLLYAYCVIAYSVSLPPRRMVMHSSWSQVEPVMSHSVTQCVFRFAFTIYYIHYATVDFHIGDLRCIRCWI